MAKTRLESLDQLLGVSAVMRITCRECEHSALYATKEIVGYFRARNWSRLFAHASVRFRCDKCGKRNVTFVVWKEPALPKPPRPEPLPHPDDRPRGSGRKKLR
jgi:ribosomal protein S27E